MSEGDKTTKILLGIIILILVVFGVYYFANQNMPVEDLQNSSTIRQGNLLVNEQKDFEILFIRWDDFIAEYNSQMGKRDYTAKKIDWENICSSNQNSNYYSVQTNQTGIFICEYSINGVTQSYTNPSGDVQRDLFSFEKDGLSTSKQIFQPMNSHINNNLTLCCDKQEKIWQGTPYGDSGYEVKATGERICDSIILPAKCS